MHKAVDQGHIRAEFVAQPQMGDAHQLYFSRIHDNQLGAVLLDGFINIIGDDRMIGRGIRADDQNDFGLQHILQRIGHRSASERGGKTCHRGGMSEAGAVIDIVGADRPRA